MFGGFTSGALDFMWGIRINNNKEWFEEHKKEYKLFVEEPMKELGAELLDELVRDCDEPELVLKVSRIYKDARRLHGSGPYKDHLWLSIREPAEEWTDKPVFWFELKPESWSFGLGYYCAKAQTMAKLRRRIDSSPDELSALMRDFNGQSEFVLEGESYAKPKGDPGELLYDIYNMKNFSLIHEQPCGEEIFSAELAPRVAEGFKLLMPFYRYLRTVDSDGL